MEAMANTAADWLVANALAVLALIVAVISLIQSHRASKRSHKTAARQLAIEEGREQDRQRQQRKARIVASIVRQPTNHPSPSEASLWIMVENKGAADAEGLSVLLDGKPIQESQAVQRCPEHAAIIASSSVRYHLNPMACQSPVVIEIRWKDGSGEPGYYHQQLAW
ncbi:MAG: hypothetical protein IT442_00295 [Phycisphaeraceae bacterium]|nr:hypothetical protein [Phycisphaeraceae bacterium]